MKDKVLAALKRVVELEHDQQSLKDAEGQVIRKLNNSKGDEPRDLPEG